MMKKINIKSAFTFFFLHFATETLCFFCLYNVIKEKDNFALMFLLYDTLAFVPQVIIGRYKEKHPNIDVGVLGGILLIIGSIILFFSQLINTNYIYYLISVIGLIFLTIGNCNTHIAGAIDTLGTSSGLSEVAIFVSGGSFGIIVGKLIAKNTNLFFIGIIAMLIAILLIKLYDPKQRDFEKEPCVHNLVKDKNPVIVVLVLALIICVRSYIGYGIPTEWNTTELLSVLLYVTMGIGKAMGGILSDKFGARVIGILSCILAIPFLLLGNNIVWVSLIGVMLFSMTMSITLGGIVSVLKNNPGVAFGITTIALYLGVVLMFLIGIPEGISNYILIGVLSILSSIGIIYTLKSNIKEELK